MSIEGITDAFKVYGQKLVTNQDEIAKQIAKRGFESITKNPGSFLKSAYKEAAGDAYSKEIADALSKATVDKSSHIIAEGVDEKTLSGLQDKYIEYRKNFSNIQNAKSVSEEQYKFLRKDNGLFYHPNKARAYFMEDGKKAARIGTYAGGAVGLRLLSGGNLTHDNTGKRDIVGIPFI